MIEFIINISTGVDKASSNYPRPIQEILGQPGLSQRPELSTLELSGCHPAILSGELLVICPPIWCHLATWTLWVSSCYPNRCVAGSCSIWNHLVTQDLLDLILPPKQVCYWFLSYYLAPLYHLNFLSFILRGQYMGC